MNKLRQQEDMKPISIFLFFFITLALLTALSFFVPGHEIVISENQRFKIPVFFCENWQDTATGYTDITEILEQSNALKEAHQDSILPELFPDSNTLADNTLPDIKKKDIIIKKDSIGKPKEKHQDATNSKDSTANQEDVDTNTALMFPIEYPDNDKTAIHSFFYALRDLRVNKRLIRVLHYGDSQIEGDRITSYIRNEFQTRFGGSGIGLFPVKNYKNNNVSVQLNISDNWHLHYIRENNSVPADHNHFGVLTGFARFNDFNAWENNTGNTFKATISMKRQSFSYLLSRKFNVFKIYYGYNQKPLMTQMTYNGIALDADIIVPSFELNVLEWKFEDTPNDFTLTFEGEDSPDVFALALDPYHGVAVDNISLRGSSGLEFTKTNPEFFSDMYNKLQVKLVLLQFGVNVVPYITNDYNFYEKRLYQQLKYLKEIHPNLAIIVMGVSDMSKKSGETYVSYPNIEKIRDAQRRAAFKARCAYWDTYSAMGGKNSMPSWVFANPPLAQKDFTHFTNKGAKVLAEMFYNSLMKDYEEFLKNK